MSAPLSCNKTRKNGRRGSIVILVAFSLVFLLVFAAIALEGGGLLEQRRKSQAAADAAAMAAAEDMFLNYPANRGTDPLGTAKNRALTIAAANGFSSGDGATVDVRLYPLAYSGGSNKGEVIPKGYVEVTVRRSQPRYFSAVIGTETTPISARAAARGKWDPAFVGIHVLDLHESGALRATGGGTGSISGGADVIVNSDAPDAAITTGGSSLTAEDFSIVGGVSGGGFNGNLHTGMQPQPDPLRKLPEPQMSDYPSQSSGPKHYSNGNRTLQPGVYHGGITITGQANVTMTPGVYYMDGGGFSFSGQGNLVADGVMIFSAPKQPSDNISLSGSNGGSVTMTPPTSGVYKGMTLFQERTSTNDMSISGNGSFFVSGTFYAANSLMNVTGNGDAHIGSQYISRLLDLNGTGNIAIDYHPDSVTPRRVLSLVE